MLRSASTKMICRRSRRCLQVASTPQTQSLDRGVSVSSFEGQTRWQSHVTPSSFSFGTIRVRGDSFVQSALGEGIARRLFSVAAPPHDVGGDESAYGPILTDMEGSKNIQNLLAWEQQCHSMFAVLASKQILGTDELRRSIEALTPQQYGDWSYYEKWTAAMVSLLMDRGLISHGELQSALFGSAVKAEAQGDEAPHPLFDQGDCVRVKKFLSNVEWKRPHIRTPGYIYGVAGTIERVCGRHGDPSFLAFGLEAPQVQLYRVRFRHGDIWPEQVEQSNVEKLDDDDDDDDVVEVEVYEHWLDAADTSEGHDFENKILFDHTTGNDCIDHSHHHHHDHDHDGESHVHEPRPHVESRAILKEGPPTPGRELFRALQCVILEKEIVSSDEVRLMCERMDTAGKRLDGGSLVVKAWLDHGFEQRLLSDATAAAAEIGINTSNPNAPTVLTVVKNTPTTHNLIVCTLCSCYPSGMLGIAPSWYKSREYRSRAVREPRRVLEEFGVVLPTDKTVRVHDSTADHRYIVLPERPIGTDNWSEDDLRSLVTRDTMIGVAVPAVVAI